MQKAARPETGAHGRPAGAKTGGAGFAPQSGACVFKKTHSPGGPAGINGKERGCV